MLYCETIAAIFLYKFNRKVVSLASSSLPMASSSLKGLGANAGFNYIVANPPDGQSPEGNQ